MNCSSKVIPQRLETKNFDEGYIVGLVETFAFVGTIAQRNCSNNSGWFSYSKNGKYVIFEGIELHLRDKPLLQVIQDRLVLVRHW